MMNVVARLAAVAATVVAGYAFAVSHQDQGAGFTDAEVRKVDRAAGKVTLKHGPIANLEMPPMTMVFRVADAGVVGDLKPGDKVRFRAEQVSGAYHVQRIEKAP